ncbi:hypothetical protein FEM48_Zijuj12G0082500 [Ziziphus jujuba var. spinosa]|uniref:Uncharacterized protein n=1 Tax=Ziziphus jujuba var. spinosa TaxID=714518 RepID=A0A978UC67_ZIZJJ|nr:hypothetical protein FEM48_Zijuj12G0082500 [Ziziphus jujuba var. spinosa]
MAEPPDENDNENGWRQLVLNNRYGLRYNPTPEILVTQILRRRVQGHLHRIPSNVLCYFRECSKFDFFQLPEYYRRRGNNLIKIFDFDDIYIYTLAAASLYFCRRMAPAAEAAGGVEVTPAGWTRSEGPIAFNINDGEGRYATYQKMNSRVIVTEYRLLPQEPNNEIALYRIVAREF